MIGKEVAVSHVSQHRGSLVFCDLGHVHCFCNSDMITKWSLFVLLHTSHRVALCDSDIL